MYFVNVMPSDLVFPKNNEEHLAQMAIRLGITHLIFCYGLKDPLLKSRQKEVAMLAHDKLSTEFAVLVTNQQEVSKARTLTRSIIGIAKPEMFEDKRVGYIIDMEMGKRDDFIHHRNSGLSQVFIEQAKRTEKVLLVNMNNLITNALPQPILLGRIMQNNDFYKKYRPDVLVVSGAREPLQMRPPRDMQAFLLL
jgi:RNase P/RNase MRP subunit p30